MWETRPRVHLCGRCYPDRANQCRKTQLMVVRKRVEKGSWAPAAATALCFWALGEEIGAVRLLKPLCTLP